jgi:homoserine kinase
MPSTVHVPTSPRKDTDEWVGASAPASSANLGCAFDCAALALNLRLRAQSRRRNSAGFTVKYNGPNPERVPCDDTNLVVEGIVRFAAAHRENVFGAEVEIESEIPVGVGLGSSAAAIVCGLFLGAALLGVEPDREEILVLAAKMEGHPDNAAAACHGGLVFAAQDLASGRVLYARTNLPGDLSLLAVIPSTATFTHEARAVLPPEYSRADVVHNMQRASLLAAICFSGAGVLEQELFRDRMHQPYRAPSVAGLAACLNVKHPDLLGVCVSGSGSSALAFVRRNEIEIGNLLARPFADCGAAPKVIVLRPEPLGARIETASAVQSTSHENEIAAGVAAGSEGRACKS